MTKIFYVLTRFSVLRDSNSMPSEPPDENDDVKNKFTMIGGKPKYSFVSKNITEPTVKFLLLTDWLFWSPHVPNQFFYFGKLGS